MARRDVCQVWRGLSPQPGRGPPAPGPVPPGAAARGPGLLAADAVRALCADRGLPAARASVADDLSLALRSSDPEVGRRARDAAAEMGLRVAWLLATLHHPDTAAAQGWSEWRRAYLRRWA